MIVFISNYYNHHQAPLSNKIYEMTGGEYRFIATSPITEERLKMGWGDDDASFVIQYSDPSEECQRLIDSADAVIFGSAPYSLIKKRLKKGKLTFLYSERIYKNGCPKWQIPLRAVSFFCKFGRYKSAYLLCASAYAAEDYAKTGTFKGKAYKWGYFPETKRYDDIKSLVKEKQPASILWVARMIGWKHPELPIKLAKRLKADGYTFTLNMIGNGELEQDMQKFAEENGVCDCVHLLGSMKPGQVREHMEKSRIFIFTSDRCEGWGAVLNESMNSGCAVAANREIGSAPYLIRHGENGFLYSDEEELYGYLKNMLDSDELCERLGVNAYRAVTEMWNHENASERLLTMIKELNGKGACTLFESGPCSAEE